MARNKAVKDKSELAPPGTALTMRERQELALQRGETPTALRVYGATRSFVRATLLNYLDVEVRGRQHLNVAGPAIIAPVHRSNLDGPIVCSLGERRIRSLAKESLFSNAAFGWYLTALGAFPVTRGAADREALKAAIELLGRGDQVLVFPEGTRQQGDGIGELFDGTMYLAGKARASVIPVGIAGTEHVLPPGAKLPSRRKVVVCVGEPIAPPGDGAKRVPRAAVAASTVTLGERLAQVQARAVRDYELRNTRS